MKTILIRFSLLLTFLFILSCHKEQSISELILGKWEWVSTLNPWGGQVSNPSTTGYTRTLEFLDNGTAKEYQNDQLVSSYNYTVQVNPTDPNDFILGYNDLYGTHFRLKNDSLIFDQAFVDGPVTTYVRKK